MKHSVNVVDYDPRWLLIYKKEKDQILEVTAGKVVAIEHVGSTAARGLGAKPIARALD